MCNGNCQNCSEAKDKERRKFLGWMVGIINVALGAAILGPVAGFVGGPLKAKAKGKWVAVVDYDALQEGTTTEHAFTTRVQDGYQEVDRKYTVFLRRHNGTVTCFDPACTHLGCRIQLQAEKKRYICPCHGGVFADDGSVVAGPPPKPLDQHRVKVEAGKVWIHKEA